MLALCISLALLLGVGPRFDPIGGEALERCGRVALPALYTPANAVDRLFTATVGLQDAAGALALFDPTPFAVHGAAWSQRRPTLNGLEIGDPGEPGEALFAVPEDAWDVLTLQSLWTSQPGLHVTTRPPEARRAPATARLRGQGGGPGGGDIWLPNAAFDRHDARRFGAPDDRRTLRQMAGLYGRLQGAGAGGAWRLHTEWLEQRHHYLRLPNDEAARRASALLVGRLPTGHPAELTVGGQIQQRSAAGAAANWPAAGTAAGRSGAALLQLRQRFFAERLRLDVGLAWRQQRYLLPGDAALRDELLEFIDGLTLLRRPQPFADRQSGRLDVSLTRQLGRFWHLTGRGSFAGVAQRWQLPGDRAALTLDGQAYREVHYALPRRSILWLGAGRGEVAWRPRWANGAADLFVGVALSSLTYGDRPADHLIWLAPAGGLSGRWRAGTWGGEFFAQARHEPWNLDATVGNFLAVGSPSGVVVDVSGAAPGRQVGVTGAAYHDVDPALRPPCTEQWAIGYSTTPLWPVRLRLAGVGRHLRRRLTVVGQPPLPATARPLGDPGGDGRGENPVAGGGQLLEDYGEDPGALASQGHRLTNAAPWDHYLGFEFALDATSRRLALHLAGVAYLSAGGAPPGSGVDRNDPGALSEASAGPNAAIHGRGRYANDRAYLLKLLLTARPWDPLSLGLSLRFRDGQPFTRWLVDPSLPQGAQAIMAVDRGEPRYTFDATCDVRLRYDWPARPLGGALCLDVYNVLGAATEVAEDPRTGPTFRRATEMIPGRSWMASLLLDLR